MARKWINEFKFFAKSENLTKMQVTREQKKDQQIFILFL